MVQKDYIPNIPHTEKKRVVMIGGGFGGLKLVRNLLRQDFQIILLDKNNFHQFQPLLYQVATAGLEPSAISFPIRKILQKEENIKRHAMSMKSAADAIQIRNTILENFELALLQSSPEKAGEFLNIVLVGGGPTGVELAGALAEMKRYIFPKDYPELDLSRMRIVLYEASGRLLSGMTDSASRHAGEYLERLGVEIHLNTRVLDYNGGCLQLSDQSTLSSRTVIWSAGIIANSIPGLTNESKGPGNRILVDRQNRIIGHKDVFAIGDLCLMRTLWYPDGHPQVSQVAIQHAKSLAGILRGIHGKKKKPSRDSEYRDKGSLATIGRNLAVADLPFIQLRGFLAWALWSFVHLFMIVGVKNRVFIFMNWSWNYFTYDQSLRLLIRHKPSKISVLSPQPDVFKIGDHLSQQIKIEGQI